MDLSALNRHSRSWSLAYVLQLIGMFGVLFASQASARADIIIDDFEDQTAGSIPEYDRPINYFSFGNQLSDRGVSEVFGAISGSKSAFYVIDFSETGDTFGVGAAHQGLNLSLTKNQSLSVYVKVAPEAVVGTQADVGTERFVAFRLQDAHGTIYRTPDPQLFSVSTAFTRISQPISDLTYRDSTAAVSLDLTRIVSVGLLFYDKNFTGTTIIVFDDLAITAVPEPNQVWALTLCGAIVGIYRLRRGVFKRKTKTGL